MSKFSITAVMGVVTDKLKKGLAGAKGGFGKMALAGAAAGAAIVAAMVMAGKAIISLGIEYVKTAATIDAGMREVFTLLPNLATDAKKKMTKEMMDLSQEMGKMPADMTTSLYNALSSGIPKENVFEFIKVAAKASIGGVSSTNEAVGALTTVLNGYKMTADKAAGVSDTLFTIIKQGVTTMPELAANIGKVTPIASALGISFVEVGAAFAELTKNLGPGKSAETGTMLKAMFAELLKGGTKLSENFKEISGKTFPDFLKAGGNLGEGLKLLIKYGKNTGKSFVDMTGSLEAGNALMILGAKGAEGFGDQMEAMGKKSGAAQKAFKEVSGGVDFAMKQMAVAWVAFKKVVGDALAPVVKLIMPAIMNTIAMMKKLPWDALGKDIANVIGSLLPLVAMFFNLAQVVFPLLGPWIKILGALFNVVLTPALVLLMKAAGGLTRQWGFVSKALGWAAGWVNKLTGQLVNLINHIGKPTFGNEWRKTLKVLKDAWDWVVDAIFQWIMTGMPRLVAFMIQVVDFLGDYIVDSVSEWLGKIIAKLEKSGSKADKTYANLLRGAKNLFDNIGKWLDTTEKRLRRYLPILEALGRLAGVIPDEINKADRSAGKWILRQTGLAGAKARILQQFEKGKAFVNKGAAERQAVIDTREGALRFNARMRQEHQLAQNLKIGKFETKADWDKRIRAWQRAVALQKEQERNAALRVKGRAQVVTKRAMPTPPGLSQKQSAAEMNRARGIAEWRKRKLFETHGAWKRRMEQYSAAVARMNQRAGGTPAQQIRAATMEQRKFNTEVQRNPMLTRGGGGRVRMTGGAGAIDMKYQKAIIKRLDTAIQQRALIYKTLKGKFVNQ